MGAGGANCLGANVATVMGGGGVGIDGVIVGVIVGVCIAAGVGPFEFDGWNE